MVKTDIKPPKGTRDLIGEDANKFQILIDKVRKVFERYGFEPLFTPAFEDFKLFTIKGGLGEAIKDEIYYFKDKSERELGLRFDLTMPLVRVIANNPNIPKPYKRYAIAPVWRYDNPQAYRYREFWQADIDIVGSPSPLADAECLACVSEVLESLGLKNFMIRVNDRRILEKLLENKVPKEKLSLTFRILDKIDKIGEEGVREELEKSGLNSNILNDLKLDGNIEEILEKTKIIEEEFSKEILQLFKYCEYYGIKEKLKFDLFLVRGLDYYTSFVFEIDFGKGVSFGGGGRYDNLIQILSGEKVPATGISIGLSRLFDYLKECEKLNELERKIFVAWIPGVEREAIRISNLLRKNNFITDINLMERRLDKQLEYAEKKNFKIVIIVGEKELREKKIRIKLMDSREEFLIESEKLVEYLKNF